MVLTTLKNYILAHYNSNEFRVPEDQKHLLRSSLLDFFYEIKSNPSALKVYQEIAFIVATADYPWIGVD